MISLQKDLEFDTKEEFSTFLDSIGVTKKLGYGKDGVVYDLGHDNSRVIKIGNLKASFGPKVAKRFKQETEIGVGVGLVGLGPKVYGYGTIKVGNKYGTYIILEKLQEISKTSGFLCDPKVQKEFVSLFIRLSELGILNKDSNPRNYMTTPDGTLKLIDFGYAVPGNTYEKALETNISTAIMAAGSTTGLFRNCPDTTPLVKELLKYSNKKNIVTFRTVVFNIKGKPTVLKENDLKTLQ
jgi:predicted Ser/Thr protein kinase